MIHMFSETSTSAHIVGIFCLVGTILWWLNAAVNIYLWIQARLIYKQKKLDRKLRKEVAENVGKQAAEHPEYVYEAGKAVTSV